MQFFKSVLKPDNSYLMGLATAGLVTAIYVKALPSFGVVHATQANDLNIDSARKKATWTSIGVLSGITLITRDVNVFVLGGIVTIALDFGTRHANAVSPTTGSLVSDQGYGGKLKSVS